MIIDNNLLAVSKVLFSNKENWKYLSVKQKEDFFFICNRFFSKKYPDYSYLLNKKNINKESALDTWYYFMYNEKYPKWFWSKSEDKKNKLEDNKFIKDFCIKNDLKEDDFYLLEKLYPSQIEEEIKYYKKIEIYDK
jgi:hypothetical protein